MPEPRRSKSFGGSSGHERLMMANLAASLFAAEGIEIPYPTAVEIQRDGLTGGESSPSAAPFHRRLQCRAPGHKA